MKRRNMLYGGAAAVAGLTGAGAAWRHAGLADDAAAAESFWHLDIETPDGLAVPMSRFRGQKLLVNFWATWCPPCIEELPFLDNFYQKNKADNWQVVGLAVDQSSAVRAWLKARPLSFPVGMAGLGGARLSQTMGNAAGSLPFSVVFGSAGGILQRKVGKVSVQELSAWAQLK